MKKQYIIIGITIIITLIQLYLVKVQPINSIDMKYDDALMLEQAYSILQEKWLGEYNSLTLVKGICFPLFLVITSCIHIPFLIMQDILYIIACGTIIFTLRKKIKNSIMQLISFSIMIYLPIIYCTEICRIYRDGIYLSLILYLLAFTLGLFLNREEKAKKLIKYYIAIGITIGLIYLCREEFIWVIPYLVVAFSIILISIIKNKKEKEKTKKISLFAIPIIIVMLITTTVKIINYKHYGVFQLNQYWSKEFKQAYGALTRIIPENKIEKVPVTKETLEKAYEISPKFAELKDYFEKNAIGWSCSGDGPKGEIQGGWFHWALIEAVEEKGYYQNAKMANEYYTQVAKEINQACEEGKVKALPYTRISNVIKFDFNDIIKSLEKMPEVCKYQYEFQDVKSRKTTQIRIVGEKTKNWVEKIEKVTSTKIYSGNNYKFKKDQIRINILETIEKTYKMLNPYLFYESIIIAIIYIIITLKKKQKNMEEIIILIGLAGIYMCRVFIISFTSVNMYTEAINVRYLAPTYAIQVLFGILANIFFIQSIIQEKRENTEVIKRNEKNSNIQSKITKDLTILIPALNEEKTIGICIKKAKKIIKENKLNAEILIINNNSIDKTEEIARKMEARVENVEKRGYGIAIQEGIKLAEGKYVIMVDADDSYNILEIMPLYEKLKQGYDLVIGNRFKGKIEKGAMKLSHRYIGTPILSWIGRKKYKISIGDFNCGLRAFDNQKLINLECESEGMEYATEMIIKAKKANLKMTEIPINFYKDKREGKSHLKTLRDGIRHLKILLKF